MAGRHSSSFDIVNSQHQSLYNRLISSRDRDERIILQRRLVNLANVMLFLVSSQQPETGTGEYF